MASREIKDLSPAMQVYYNKFADKCRRDTWLLKNGISILLICTFRSLEDQAALYAQGRTKPGPIVTNAKPGKSHHNTTTPNGVPSAEAFDIVPLRYGKAIWGTKGNGIDENPDDDATDDKEVWDRIGAHGKAVGLKWYGSPGSPFREMPHFQNPDV